MSDRPCVVCGAESSISLYGAWHCTAHLTDESLKRRVLGEMPTMPQDDSGVSGQARDCTDAATGNLGGKEGPR